MTTEEALEIFHAEPTRLTKQELIELGESMGVKLNMKQKEATMINKISDDIASKVVEVEIKDVEPAPVVIDQKPASKVGSSPLVADKVYKLSLSQRSSLNSAGQSVSKIPKEMTGADIMKYKNWQTLGL